MNKELLKGIVNQLFTRGKGILAMDESHKTLKKRFEQVKLSYTLKTRLNYRELLITTEGIEDYLSGIILFEETIRQQASNNITFSRILQQKGILIGVKADTGLVDLALHEGEKITEGLDGLKERIENYKSFGASFAKWRALIKIGNGLPSSTSIQSNTHALARFSAICQQLNIVPIMELDISRYGNHSLLECFEVTKKSIDALVKELDHHHVFIEGSILKINMITSSDNNCNLDSPQRIADFTNKCLTKTIIPRNLGVLFLSGGQSCLRSTENLNSIVKSSNNNVQRISFCFGRAIQNPVLASFSRNDLKSLKDEYMKRLRMNSLASTGEWFKELE